MVIRTGSFADAARQLGYTGSAVSQQISSLERSIRMPLFERSAHSVRPTQAAHFLAEQSQEVLQNITALEDELVLLGEGQLGRLRLGSFPSASQRLLPQALAILLAGQPLVEVTLDEAEPRDLIVGLEEGGLDLALVYRYDLVPQRWSRSLSRKALLDEELVLLLPEGHHLVGVEDLHLSALAGERWISTKEGTAGTIALTRRCAAEGFAPTVAVRSNDYDTIRSFVRCGLGIALVPALSHVESAGVSSSRLSGLGVRRHVFVQHRGAGTNPVMMHALAAIEAATESLTRNYPGVTLPRA